MSPLDPWTKRRDGRMASRVIRIQSICSAPRGEGPSASLGWPAASSRASDSSRSSGSVRASVSVQVGCGSEATSTKRSAWSDQPTASIAQPLRGNAHTMSASGTRAASLTVNGPCTSGAGGPCSPLLRTGRPCVSRGGSLSSHCCWTQRRASAEVLGDSSVSFCNARCRRARALLGSTGHATKRHPAGRTKCTARDAHPRWEGQPNVKLDAAALCCAAPTPSRHVGVCLEPAGTVSVSSGVVASTRML
mmetsp:Transcript_41375/g.100420  ORF Transcript_41375/g.100420 Transcript_41375/m.100420 type:complete len:248 (+) Transcript_41375:398-1141(+)